MPITKSLAFYFFVIAWIGLIIWRQHGQFRQPPSAHLPFFIHELNKQLLPLKAQFATYSEKPSLEWESSVFVQKDSFEVSNQYQILKLKIRRILSHYFTLIESRGEKTLPVGYRAYLQSTQTWRGEEIYFTLVHLNNQNKMIEMRELFPHYHWSSWLPMIFVLLALPFFKRFYVILCTGILIGALAFQDGDIISAFFSIIQDLLWRNGSHFIDLSLYLMGFVLLYLVFDTWESKTPAQVKKDTPTFGLGRMSVLAILLSPLGNVQAALVLRGLLPSLGRLPITSHKMAAITTTLQACFSGFLFFGVWFWQVWSSNSPSPWNLIENPEYLFWGITILTFGRLYTWFTLIGLYISYKLRRDLGLMAKLELNWLRISKNQSKLQGPDEANSTQLGLLQSIRNNAYQNFWILAAVAVAAFICIWDFVHKHEPHQALQEAFFSINARNMMALSLIILACALVLSGRQMGEFWKRLARRLTERIDWWLYLASSLLILIIFQSLVRELSLTDFWLSLGQSHLRSSFLPILIFLVAGLMSFFTGQSELTMVTLLSLLVSSNVWATGMWEPIIIFVAILEGCAFGAQNSPFGLVLSSAALAIKSSPVELLKAQAPYTLLAFAFALFFGYFSFMTWLHPLIALAIGSLFWLLILKVFGRAT